MINLYQLEHDCSKAFPPYIKIYCSRAWSSNDIIFNIRDVGRRGVYYEKQITIDLSSSFLRNKVDLIKFLFDNITDLPSIKKEKIKNTKLGKILYK
jgi:hypothetical protein